MLAAAKSDSDTFEYSVELVEETLYMGETLSGCFKCNEPTSLSAPVRDPPETAQLRLARQNVLYQNYW